MPERYLVRWLLSILEKSPAKVSQNRQHLLKNSVMGVCEQEVNDTILRKERESIPFLFSSYMNKTLVSKQKTYFLPAIPSVFQT